MQGSRTTEPPPQKLDLSFTDRLGVLVSRGLRLLYFVLFAWWYDIPVVRREEKRLAAEIRETLPFLFDEHSAEIIPDEKMRIPFSHAIVIVAIGDLLLRFVRGRGDFTIAVAARGQIRDWRDWKDIETVRQVLDESQESHRPVWLRNLYDAERLLRAELPRLLEATSAEHWDLVKRKANAVFPAPLRIR